MVRGSSFKKTTVMSIGKMSTATSIIAAVLFILLLLLKSSKTSAQNVGIGTNSPQAKLDVKGNLRAGGLTNYLLYDSLSGKFTWSNSTLWLPNAQYIIQHSASAEGLYYGNSQLEYRYQDGTPRFFTNWSTGNGYFYGRLGIGTVNPLAKLHVADSSVVFSGSGFATSPANDPPVSGAGKRMMWYADKAAFRAGYVQNDEWDNDNVGGYSFAAGFNTKAKGLTSIALGNTASALAHYSTSIGINSNAIREYTTAIGPYSTASGTGSTAIGYGAIAKAIGGVAMGTFNDTSDAPDLFTPALSDRIFQIGNGYVSYSNALTVLRNGSLGLGILSPSQRLHVGTGQVRI